MEALSWESQFNKNKHWICRINLVFIHRTNNMSWFCRDNNNNNNKKKNNKIGKNILNLYYKCIMLSYIYHIFY